MEIVDLDNFNKVELDSTGRVVCVRIDKMISGEGYRQILRPILQSVIQKHGELRILVQFDRYKGRDAAAAKEDMITLAKIGTFITKLGLINPPEEEVFRRAMSSNTIGGELKFFAEGQYDRAMEWILQ